MNNIKMSEALWQTAEAVIAIGKKAGITITIVQLYNKDTIHELALISNFLLQQVKTVSGLTIEVIDDSKTG